MSDLPPPPPPNLPPPPPPGGFGAPPPPGYSSIYGSTAPPALSLAGFWIRFVGFIVDALVIGIPFWILGAIFGDNTSTRTYPDGSTSQSTGLRFSIGWNPQVPLWLNVLNTVVGLVYFGYFEGGPTGQTLGKRVVGIRVADATTGLPGIGFGRAVGRYFARILSALPCLLGYFWMLWDGRKQTWHDKVVTSVVVKG